MPDPAPMSQLVVKQPSNGIFYAFGAALFLVVMMNMGLVAYMIHKDSNRDSETGSIDESLVVAAKEYGSSFAKNDAETWKIAKKAILAGDEMTSVQAQKIKAFQELTKASFNRLIVPSLDSVMPPGEAVPTPSQRQEYARKIDAIIKGLSGK